MLKEIVKGKIFEIHIEIATIAMELNKFSKIQIYKIFKIQIEVGTIASSLNEISKIQIGMHTPMLNEIFKDKIFSSLFNEISKIATKIFEIRTEMSTIASLLNEIYKITFKVFEIYIEIGTITLVLNAVT